MTSVANASTVGQRSTFLWSQESSQTDSACLLLLLFTLYKTPTPSLRAAPDQQEMKSGETHASTGGVDRKKGVGVN